MSSTSSSRAVGLTALAAIFWGTNFEATRFVLTDLSPWTAAALRFAVAAAIILLWLILTEGIDRRGLARNAPAFVVLGALGIAGFNAALCLGMGSSSPVTAALIMATTPLSTNLIDALVARRMPRPAALLGMALSLTGVALTVGAFAGAALSPGDLMILGGSLCVSCFTVFSRRWVKESSPLATTTWTMVAGALLLLTGALAFEHPLAEALAAPAPVWGVTLWMAIAGSVLAFLFWTIGIRVRGPGPTAILFNIVPVSALVIATLAGRMPGPAQLGGVTLTILGVLVASGRLRLPGRRPARA
ncbi:DMT family transporter [Pseudooceanicola sp. CBS1P-1]|uniref:EamA family transporter n=1 Tax=Pseudooceanicola albus TaxID=2692189 RepID=A0A6L7G5J7_9RHOB|nr:MULTISPECIES: DMT family transporter [Pseudooceanicola]MBT9385344.1 DMT family transporter [Pseudooceanicola endophyticus]MXN18797.1 EamA family transporter [Pseudooceanicola albus]